ncbi:hypothetical protein [Streptomyces sp. rh34]|uniref:hypothetical protein n=1 Tax=Streptomyces sp. rh34 TaxID=2034272 RepID=UPI0015CF0054|nr:hypothetical protein [Streptomyces sp. rh34]
MNATQQYLFDLHRAARLSQPAPPPPGRHDRSVLRDLYRHWLTHPPTRRSGDPGGPGTPGEPGTPGPSGV